MTVSKALLLAFIFTVTLLIVSDVVAARKLATETFATQYSPIAKVSKQSTNGGPIGYPPASTGPSIGYPPGK